MLAGTCLALIIFFNLGATSNLQSKEELENELEFLFQGMRHERLQLSTGVCHIKGVMMKVFHDDAGKNVNKEIDVSVVLGGSNRIRFDITQPGFVYERIDNDPDVDHTGQFRTKGTIQNITTKYSNDGKRAAIYRNNQNDQVNIMRARDNVSPPELIGFFDVRAFGLYRVGTLGGEKPFDQQLDSFFKAGGLTRVEKYDKEPWCIVWTGEVKKQGVFVETRLWVDPARGFTPVRLTHKEKFVDMKPNQTPNIPKNVWITTDDNKTSWEKVDGVWVPVHSELTIRERGGSWSESIVFDLKWDDVNKPVENKVFEWESFGVPETAGVYDHTTGKLITIRQRFAATQQQVKSSHPLGKKYRLLVAAILLCIIGLLLLRKYRRQKNIGSEA